MGTTMEVDGHLFECIANGPLCAITVAGEGLASIAVSPNGDVIISMEKATMDQSLQGSYLTVQLIYLPCLGI